MAMFDLKDSEDVKLSECHTDSRTLLKAEGVKRLNVEKSSALGTARKSKTKVFSSLPSQLFAAGLSLAVTLIGGYLIYCFGWNN